MGEVGLVAVLSTAYYPRKKKISAAFPSLSRSHSFPVLAERRRTPPVRQNAAPEREALSMASGVDRISALPEDVLHNVLRFLPAQEVLRTCVLARRWRAVWRSVPTLLFTGAEGWGSAERFAQFVDNLLHLRCGGDGGAGAPLDSCDFNFFEDEFMVSPANERRASNWIWKAVHRVRVLGLHIAEEDRPSPLSDLHLVSQHLTKLHLDGVSVNDSVVDFSGCPALVELTMEFCFVFVEHLLSPSLKHLRLTRCDSSNDTRILMCLPSLVSLELIDWQQGRVPLLGNLPWLARAVVELGIECADQCSKGRFDDCGADLCHGCRYYYYGDAEYGPGYDRNDSIFLKSLSEATDLELSAKSDVVCLQLFLSQFLILYYFCFIISCAAIISMIRNHNYIPYDILHTSADCTLYFKGQNDPNLIRLFCTSPRLFSTGI